MLSVNENPSFYWAWAAECLSGVSVDAFWADREGDGALHRRLFPRLSPDDEIGLYGCHFSFSKLPRRSHFSWDLALLPNYFIRQQRTK